MPTSPRTQLKGVRFNAPVLDTAVRRFARPAPRRLPAMHSFHFHSESTMTRLLSAAAAALMILAAASAQAETKQLTIVSTTLEFHTRDLTDPAGAARMLARIELAAQRLCTPTSPVARQTSRTVLACRHAAIERAVATLGAPMVTAAYSAGQPDLALAAR
jgi:UrcA family protein